MKKLKKLKKVIMLIAPFPISDIERERIHKMWHEEKGILIYKPNK